MSVRRQAITRTNTDLLSLEHWKQTLVKFETKYKTFHSENVFENVVCEMAPILSREVN